MSIRRLLSPAEPWKRDVDTRVALQEVLNLKDKDQYLEAGARAGKLFDEGTLELRVLGILLYGTYLDQGLEVLPELFLAAEAALNRHWEFALPTKNREKQAENSLRWFFSRMRRETLERTENPSPEWLARLAHWPLTRRRQAYDALRTLRRLMLERFENDELHGQCAALLDWLDTLHRNRLGLPAEQPSSAETSAGEHTRSARTTAVVQPPVASQQDPSDEDEEDTPPHSSQSLEPPDSEASLNPLPLEDQDDLEASIPPPTSARPVRRVLAWRAAADDHQGDSPSVSALPVFRSKALEALHERLQAFEQLVMAGQLVLASVLVDEIQHELESFDPRRYLPELFSTFYALQVEQRLGLQEAQHHASRELLTMLYRVDAARFMALDVQGEE